MKAVKKSTKPRNKKLVRMKPEDVQSILYELDAWEQGERGKKLVWDILERLSGFSRQSLWAKSEIKNRFESVKETLRQGIDKNDSNQYRRTLEQRIDSLEKEINQLKQQQNYWLELWARYEYNSRVMGIDTARLEQPLPFLNRK